LRSIRDLAFEVIRSPFLSCISVALNSDYNWKKGWFVNTENIVTAL